MIKNLLIAVILFLCYAANSAIAQTTQASISGIVTDEQKKPIPGVSVQIRNNSTGFSTRTSTNAQGEYTFKELPLGGPYTVKAIYIGYAEQNRTGYMLNQGDAVKVAINMQETAQNLGGVEINGSSLRNKVQQFGASTEISSKTMNLLPVNGRNFSSLTDLSPLSGASGIAGQLGSSTNFTIDGMTAKNPTSAGSTNSRSGAPYSISIESVREFKVVTNQYDVSLGRAGGGTISAVTKSGTNQVTGSAFAYNRADFLASQYDIRGNKRVNDFSTYQYGFSLGGPIIKDKLHYFAAWDHQRDSRPLIIADINSLADEARFNVTNTTLKDFLTVARNKYGVANTPQYGSFDKKRGTDAGFLRLDWQIDDKNLLTVRDNYTNDRNPLGLADNTAINFYESYGNDKNVDNSLLATLRSTVSSKVTNELKVQHLYTFQASTQNDELSYAIPRAIVNNVPSTLSNGSNVTTAIQIGGHRFGQEGFTNNVFQLVDNIYYNTDKIKYTFGIDIMYTHAKSLYGSEVNGRFEFTNSGTKEAGNVQSSVQNFNNLIPNRYYREVPLVADPTVTGKLLNSAIYGQMQTKLGKGLDFTGGLRLDYSKYPTSPLNQQLYDAIGVRTDNELKQFLIQPRIQLDWDVNEKHTDYVRLGAGIFGSDVNNYVTINNLTFDGKHFGTVDITSGIPTPDFAGYRNGTVTAPALPGSQLATINTYADDAKLPVVYKANLSYNKLINEKIRIGITGYATLARNNYMYVDRNMAANPYFTLANEGNRGVFVPSIPSNGVADWKTGRLTTNTFGRVLELNSKGKVNQFAIVVDGTWKYFKDGEITASYTWNDAKDNTSYNGNVANSATLSLPVVDDPRNLSKMTYSNGQFRNKVIIYGTLPSFHGIKAGVRYSAIGGTRYSLLSGSNTNGDFVSTNDLAFIFDRNNPSTPANVRNGLQALLDNPLASKSLKDYILKYEGTFAERNGGINGFYGTIDLRLAYQIKFGPGKKQSVEISGDLFNVANLFKKTWGTSETLGTQAIYGLGIPAVKDAAGTEITPAVANYDTTKRQFNYRINNSGLVTPSGNPWQAQIGLRYGF
ncbi:Carboxypeptidase regulatory-like domain-containing protein [Pedobacter terrae]|uniref:Carboxypeptidase regulatory-like domain-containing protein n=1 Tax=Pedobacter terrae TaxID=405671 RepID=A0A1G8BLC5_9SPHI|nr:carboxypeptidase regulatory-like domain-containing protein [Pedobacter terrae]SDH33370.1 Carboxypeptidase regulatory-like domain-containing protein [Pedobacter terrae]